MIIRTRIISDRFAVDLEEKLAAFLEDVGWDRILHISYSRGEDGTSTSYSVLIVYKF